MRRNHRTVLSSRRSFLLQSLYGDWCCVGFLFMVHSDACQGRTHSSALRLFRLGDSVLPVLLLSLDLNPATALAVIVLFAKAHRTCRATFLFGMDMTVPFLLCRRGWRVDEAGNAMRVRNHCAPPDELATADVHVHGGSFGEDWLAARQETQESGWREFRRSMTREPSNRQAARRDSRGLGGHAAVLACCANFCQSRQGILDDNAPPSG